MKFNTFHALAYRNTTYVITYFLEKQLLFTPICNICGEEANPTPTDRFLYRCNKSIRGEKCGFKRSLLYNSVFKDAKIPLQAIFLIIDKWRCGTVCEIVAEDLKIDESSVSRWYRKMDDIVIWRRGNLENQMIGGDGVIVEVDECLCVKRKYHRGRILQNQVWIFGGVERGNNQNYFIEVIESRSRVNLLEVIRRRVRSGSIIMTDLWRGYANLTIYLFENNYLHYTVNHSVNFVDPDTGAYTQSIEGFWSVYKKMARKKKCWGCFEKS